MQAKKELGSGLAFTRAGHSAATHAAAKPAPWGEDEHGRGPYGGLGPPIDAPTKTCLLSGVSSWYGDPVGRERRNGMVAGITSWFNHTRLVCASWTHRERVVSPITPSDQHLGLGLGFFLGRRIRMSYVVPEHPCPKASYVIKSSPAL